MFCERCIVFKVVCSTSYDSQFSHTDFNGIIFSVTSMNTEADLDNTFVNSHLTNNLHIL